MDLMGQWVQDALDAIEYANGPVDSVWGSLRAKNGHPEPFNLKYLEIGNENGGPAYHERWELFYKAIKAKYPDIQLIANVWGGYPTKSMPEIIDEHYYNNPEFFMLNAHKYDSYDRKGPRVFVGEYAVTQGCGQGNLRGAIGEAAFMTGMERNSDIVIMASYAPLLVNVNHRKWNPDLINYDSSRIYGLPSYYVQQLFSVHRGDVVLPTRVEASMTSTALEGGCIGVGTWMTRAEFKDIKVVKDGKTLFESDFSKGSDGWKMLGAGKWQVKDGALQQEAMTENVRAVAGDKSWTDYILTVKARKISGDEGFLILFNVQNEEAKSWWNIGGWGNSRHAVEMGGVSDEGVRGRVETGKWYDIRIEVKDNRVRCFLDDKLIHDMTTPSMKALYASATLDTAAKQIILKAVNVDEKPQDTEIDLSGVTVGTSAEMIVLTSEKSTDENSLDNPTKVSPVTKSIEIAGAKFRMTFAPNSLTILRIPCGRNSFGSPQ
jgi:alpha-L-arabinofuranosidase